MDFQQQSYDAIVVGSGPGGATVAKELSEQGKKVLILEWGANPKLRGGFFQFALHQLIPFKSFLLTNKFLSIMRGIITGGSTAFYYATSFPVPVEMLKSHGIDISEELEEVHKELPIGPLKDEMITPMANKIMESAQSLGYKWEKLDKMMYQDAWAPDKKFGYYGDPEGVNWSAKSYIDHAIGNGAVLLNKAKANKIILNNNAAAGIEFKHKGKKCKVFAPVVIVSAGGIGTPELLKNSGFKGVGENYFFDPIISVCGVVKDLKAGNEIPMSAGIHMEEEGYMMADMSLPPALDAIFSAQVLRFHRLFSQKRTLRIMIKAKDSLGGTITKNGQVRKNLAAEDKQKLLKGYKRAKEILKKAGAKGIFKTWYFAAHPGGTVKIGDFLDTNLMTTHPNLYVCDCSVIPEPWGLPPTLTLVCLGKRLAKHLNKKMGGIS